MKQIYLLLISLLCIVIKGTTQEKPIDVRFEKQKDTIYADSDTKSYKVKLKVPKQPDHKNPKVVFKIDNEKTNVANLMLPAKTVYQIDNSKDEELEFEVWFKRDSEDGKNLAIQFDVTTADNKPIKLVDDKKNITEVWIRPYPALDGVENEYWLFVGTNFDLLDGIKANDLYFRGSFLIPINNNAPKQHQIYLTFEKNRFFSSKDSLYRISLSDVVYKPGLTDSLIMAKGMYDSFRETITENLGFSLSYLYNLNKHPSEKYNSYIMGGIYIDHQNITYKYSNHNIVSDTTTILRDSSNKSLRIYPLAQKQRSQNWNYNFFVGAMYIHSGKSVNLKTFVQAGYNRMYFPESTFRSGLTERALYRGRNNLFARFHLDATLLESPGISFGGEVYIRGGSLPLFNFTLTKVFDYRQLKNLFNKVPSQN